MAIYDNIKRVAKGKNISIRELEISSGLSRGAISKWNVSQPKVFAIRKVAALLEVSIDDLLRGE